MDIPTQLKLQFINQHQQRKHNFGRLALAIVKKIGHGKLKQIGKLRLML